MLIKETKYCYNDIAVVPAIKSNIEHRGECNPYIGEFENSPLPIFTAPMSTVVNEQNFKLFEDNHIIPILPRNISYETRLKYLRCGKWVAVSLTEFEDLFVTNDWDWVLYPYVNVLIDIANGHMSRLHELVYEAKGKYGWRMGFIIMVGNIANPQTYYELAKAGVDFVRCSVGSGSGCLSSSNLGVHYPIASLISEIYEIKKKLDHAGENAPMIIADGGVRGYADVIKAEALGADFVMCGGIFSQLVESAAPTFYYQNDGKSVTEVNPFKDKITPIPNGGFDIDGEHIVDNLHKVFYGMASRRGQEDISGEKTKTSEGVQKIFDCTTTIAKWSENMADYFKSAMSYTNCYRIDDFNPENVDCVVISQQTKESINK